MGRRLQVFGLGLLVVCAVFLVVFAPGNLEDPNWPLLGGLAAGVILGGIIALANKD